MEEHWLWGDVCWNQLCYILVGASVSSGSPPVKRCAYSPVLTGLWGLWDIDPVPGKGLQTLRKC